MKPAGIFRDLTSISIENLSFIFITDITIISICDIQKIVGAEGKQNPLDST
jgi:hypothetical protein